MFLVFVFVVLVHWCVDQADESLHHHYADMSRAASADILALAAEWARADSPEQLPLIPSSLPIESSVSSRSRTTSVGGGKVFTGTRNSGVGGDDDEPSTRSHSGVASFPRRTAAGITSTSTAPLTPNTPVSALGAILDAAVSLTVPRPRPWSRSHKAEPAVDNAGGTIPAIPSVMTPVHATAVPTLWSVSATDAPSLPRDHTLVPKPSQMVGQTTQQPLRPQSHQTTKGSQSQSVTAARKSPVPVEVDPCIPDRNYVLAVMGMFDVSDPVVHDEGAYDGWVVES